MQRLRFQPAASWLMAAIIAAWFIAAPLLVICTCQVGHAAITTTSHAQPACGHAPCGAADSADEGTQDHAPSPHNDSDLTLDATPIRVADALSLPAFDFVIALLPDFTSAPGACESRCRMAASCDTGPPASMASLLASTILLI